jgi:putative hydrolase of the HAD superfamily
MTPRLVSFDAVGTLIAPHPGVGAIYAEVAAAFGLEREPADLDAAFRPAFAAAVARWPVAYGADEEDARRFWGEVVAGTFAEPLPYEIVRELYDTFAGGVRWRALPGAREAVALVAGRGLPAAVVTNFDGRVRSVLADLGLGPFATIVASAEVGAAKPDPAGLRLACRRLGIDARDTLHLGDSAREDGGMCAAAGAQWMAVDPARGIPLAMLAERLGG